MSDSTRNSEGLSPRRYVFISHAAPENNDFVRWLGARLAVQGYSIWSDVTRLRGGDVIWEEIEKVIRKETAVFLVVMSKSSYKKEGVLAEIEIAESVNRRDEDRKFIIPIRLDDLPFRDFPRQLSGIHAIDFSKGWASGLIGVISALESEPIPRRVTKETLSAIEWSSTHSTQDSTVKNGTEEVLSNRFRIVSVSEHVKLLKLASAQANPKSISQALNRTVATHSRFGLCLSNSAESAVDDCPNVEQVRDICLLDILRGNDEERLGASRRACRNMITRLFNKSWREFAEKKQLVRHKIATGEAWYVPHGLLEDNVAYFTEKGKTRWRLLAGKSKQRKAHWHFAVSPKINFSNPFCVLLQSHVVFTSEELKPISKERSHLLRRSYCKNWWNDRWCSMLRAFTNFLSDSTGVFDMSLSDCKFISVSAEPIRFFSALSIMEDARYGDEDPNKVESEEDIDKLDDGIDIVDGGYEI